jgi:hypothetical protein
MFKNSKIMLEEVRPLSFRFSNWIIVMGVLNFKEIIINFFNKMILSKTNNKNTPFIIVAIHL